MVFICICLNIKVHGAPHFQEYLRLLFLCTFQETGPEKYIHLPIPNGQHLSTYYLCYTFITKRSPKKSTEALQKRHGIDQQNLGIVGHVDSEPDCIGLGSRAICVSPEVPLGSSSHLL